MKKTTLSIKGMHCASCTTLIKDALEEHKGVQFSSVDLKTGKATITFDEKTTSEQELISVIKAEGYSASK